MSDHTAPRRPICCHCGKLGTRWFQPLIGTENFCSVACAQAYTHSHRFNGQAQAIHTADCQHFAADGQATDENILTAIEDAAEVRAAAEPHSLDPELDSAFPASGVREIPRRRKPRRPAVLVDCPGVTNDGRQAHAMRDQCWNCAPFWERIPTCPDDRTKLTTSGYCKTCRKHFETNAE